MNLTKSIKTRDLLRNFKTIKESLASGRVHFVVIDIGDNKELELAVKRPKNTAENILRHVLSRPKPRQRLRRTHFFDDLFRPRT